MLRRIPATLLVYLVILLPTLFVAASWAATPDESMEILLKPNPTSNSPMPGVNEAAPRHAKRTKREWLTGQTRRGLRSRPAGRLRSWPIGGLRSRPDRSLRSKSGSHVSATARL